jgi:hypothetical protein
VVRDVVATVSGVRVLVVTSDKKQRVQRLELDNEVGRPWLGSSSTNRFQFLR